MEMEMATQRFQPRLELSAEEINEITNACEQLQGVKDLAKKVHSAVKKAEACVSQFLQQLTSERALAVWQMTGSAIKIVGAVTIFISSLYPRLRPGVGIGRLVMNLGIGLKVGHNMVKIIKNARQEGLQKTIEEFLWAAWEMKKNLHSIAGGIKMLQSRFLDKTEVKTPKEFLFDVLKADIPSSLHPAVKNLINIAFDEENKATQLIDYFTCSSKHINASSFQKLFSELKSLKYQKFAEEMDSKFLLAVGSILVISHEILDFLEGADQFSDVELTTFEAWLLSFKEESATIMRLASIAVDFF